MITSFGNQLLDTEDGESKIRINLYNTPDRIYTANCVRLVSTNHFSSEGVVHMLNGVMKPAVKTIAQLLEDEPHFSSFRHRQFHLIHFSVFFLMKLNDGLLTLIDLFDLKLICSSQHAEYGLVGSTGKTHSIRSHRRRFRQNGPRGSRTIDEGTRMRHQ